MKLTNYIRDTFVRAVANDVPEVKFPLAAKIQELALEKMDQTLRVVWENEKFRHILSKTHISQAADYGHYNKYVFLGDVKESDIIGDLIKAAEARATAISKVRQVAYACTTLKQLRQQLPELEKYMPDEAGKVTKNVPMVLNVVEDLKKAGFPK